MEVHQASPFCRDHFGLPWLLVQYTSRVASPCLCSVGVSDGGGAGA